MGPARYPEEFKRDAVQPVLSSGRSIGSVAKELGVNTESLRQWVRMARPATGGDGDVVTPAEREELKDPDGQASVRHGHHSGAVAAPRQAPFTTAYSCTHDQQQ
nr:transposase [Streptomyces sp. V4I2]